MPNFAPRRYVLKACLTGQKEFTALTGFSPFLAESRIILNNLRCSKARSKAHLPCTKRLWTPQGLHLTETSPAVFVMQQQPYCICKLLQACAYVNVLLLIKLRVCLSTKYFLTTFCEHLTPSSKATSAEHSSLQGFGSRVHLALGSWLYGVETSNLTAHLAMQSISASLRQLPEVQPWPLPLVSGTSVAPRKPLSSFKKVTKKVIRAKVTTKHCCTSDENASCASLRTEPVAGEPLSLPEHGLRTLPYGPYGPHLTDLTDLIRTLGDLLSEPLLLHLLGWWNHTLSATTLQW